MASECSKPSDCRREAVVIVDPFSSGGIPLIDDLRDSGVFIICILSSKLLNVLWTVQWKPELYDGSLEHENIEDTLAFIKSFEGVDVKAIFPGSEPGVLLAEELQAHFSSVGRNSGPSDKRRHKYEMHRALRENGIRGMVEILTGDVEEALRWIRKTTSYPVIIKPPMSAGSEGLYYCHCDQDVREAFLSQANHFNILGLLNAKLLVQEFLDGAEYVVDAISYEGKHLIVAIWRYSKLKDKDAKSITYEYTDFLPYEGEVQDQLREYIVPTLDALGVRFGATHTEIIIDSRGPCMVECGARLHGGVGPVGTTVATGFSPVSLLTDIALHDARLFNDLYKRNGYILKKFTFFVDLRNFKYEGVLIKSIEEEIRKNLPTARYIHSQPAGSRIEITRDMISSPGYCLMSHPSRKVLMDQYAALRAMEDGDLYIVEEEAASDVADPTHHEEESHMNASSMKEKRIEATQEAQNQDGELLFELIEAQ